MDPLHHGIGILVLVEEKKGRKSELRERGGSDFWRVEGKMLVHQ